MSKRFIAALLSVILLSACSFRSVTITPPTQEVQNIQPTPLNTQESVPTVTATPLIVAETPQPLPTFACPGAPAPQVKIGQQVTVLVDNSDKLKLRSEPRISPDTVTKELDQSSELSILQGPACVSSDETGTSYWFWQVRVLPSGEFGWVAEGDSVQYFIEESTAVEQMAAATELVCTNMSAPRLSIGHQGTVVTENTDKLKLRDTPAFSPNTVVMELEKFTKLSVLEGPVCAYSNETKIYYWLWKVQVLPTGPVGWVAEGDFFRIFVE